MNVMNVLFLNFGHAATPVVAEGYEVVRVNIPVPNLSDPSDPQEVEAAVLDLVRGSDDAIRDAAANGHMVVVGLPGASGVSGVILALLNGVLGYFPKAIVGVRTESGFVYKLDKVFNLVQTRDTGRGLRAELGL